MRPPHLRVRAGALRKGRIERRPGEEMTHEPRAPAEASFDEALHLHQAARRAEAEAAYRRILEAQPDHAGALHLLGVIRQQQGCHEEALGLIGRAIEINPNKAVYHNNYGAAPVSLARLAEATESFQRALTIRPRYADALANLGMAQALGIDKTAAEESFRRALQIQPWHQGATTRLATLLGELGRVNQARELLEAALVATPCAEFHAALGNLVLRTGLPDEAVEQYRLAIKLKPNDAISHFNFGNACEELHDTDGAQLNFGRAAELRPEKRLWRLRALMCGPVVLRAQTRLRSTARRWMPRWRSGNSKSQGQNPKSEIRKQRGNRRFKAENPKRPHPRPLSRIGRGEMSQTGKPKSEKQFASTSGSSMRQAISS